MTSNGHKNHEFWIKLVKNTKLQVCWASGRPQSPKMGASRPNWGFSRCPSRPAKTQSPTRGSVAPPPPQSLPSRPYEPPQSPILTQSPLQSLNFTPVAHLRPLVAPFDPQSPFEVSVAQSDSVAHLPVARMICRAIGNCICLFSR